MKTKTFLELVSLSSAIYTLSKQTDLVDKITAYAEKGKDKFNEFVKEKMVDDEGNELEFLDKLATRIQDAKSDLEEKIGEVITSFYEKIHLVHTEQLNKLEQQITDLSRSLTLAEAKINRLEGSEK